LADDERPAHGPRLIRGDKIVGLGRRLVIVRLGRLQEFIRRGNLLAYRRISGLSAFESHVLALVCEIPELSINDLSAHTRRNVGQVSRTVKKLVETGLLNRENRGGGPGVAVTPTPHGRAVYAPLVAEAEQANDELIAGVLPEDLAALERCVAVMMDNALARLAREQDLQGADPDD
jgi:DNA-binding MarR family transcriptional regulator